MARFFKHAPQSVQVQSAAANTELVDGFGRGSSHGYIDSPQASA